MRLRHAAAAHAAYYLTTGPASYVSRRGFEAVTGPKTEWWLVNTVGGLVSVVGTTLAAAAARDRVTPEIVLLGAGTATVMAAIDVTYVARGRIRPTYLVDAAVQGLLLAAWGLAARR